MFIVHSFWLVGKHIFALLRQQPYIQRRKSIPTYKINTLTYAFCFWQFVVEVQVVAVTTPCDDSCFAFVQPLQAAHPVINILIRATLYVQRV